VVVGAMEPEVQSQVGMEVDQEVGCHWRDSGDLDFGLNPHNLPRPV
jgi:hypothetical protein